MTTIVGAVRVCFVPSHQVHIFVAFSSRRRHLHNTLQSWGFFSMTVNDYSSC